MRQNKTAGVKSAEEKLGDGKITVQAGRKSFGENQQRFQIYTGQSDKRSMPFLNMYV